MVSSPFHRISVITTELTQHMINLIVETFNVAVETLCGFRACACFPAIRWRRRGRAYAIFPQMGKAISSICKGPSYHSAWSRIIKDGTRTAVGAAAAMRSKSSVVFSFEIIFL